MIPTRCRFGWHNWPKWSAMQQHEVVVHSAILGKSVDATVFKQTRTCPDCGLTQQVTTNA